MIDRLKPLALVAAFGILFSTVAVARETPRLELDWEPNPKDRSYIKVAYDACCNPKIVCLTGGKKIRPRVRKASSSRD